MNVQPLTDDEIKAIATYYQEPLTNCWATAFEDYSNNYPETKHIHSPRSRASLLHDHCVHHAQIMLAGYESVIFPNKRRGLFLIGLGGKPIGIDGFVLARLKKLNEKLLTSNILTKQVGDFNKQRSFPVVVQGELFGEPLTLPHNAPHINIGYLPDKFWLGLDAVYATMPNGNHSLRWYVRLGSDGDMIDLPVIDMPFTQPSQPIVRTSTVKAKRTDERKNKENKG